jgi:hypothetical protein
MASWIYLDTYLVIPTWQWEISIGVQSKNAESRMITLTGRVHFSTERSDFTSFQSHQSTRVLPGSVLGKLPDRWSQVIRTSKQDQTRNTIRHRAGDPISTFGAVNSHFAISALNSRVFITFSCKLLWVKSLVP